MFFFKLMEIVYSPAFLFTAPKGLKDLWGLEFSEQTVQAIHYQAVIFTKN